MCKRVISFQGLSLEIITGSMHFTSDMVPIAKDLSGTEQDFLCSKTKHNVQFTCQSLVPKLHAVSAQLLGKFEECAMKCYAQLRVINVWVKGC